MHQNFFRPRLQNVAENLTRELPRCTTSDRWNFDHFAALIVAQRRARRATDGSLDSLSLRNRSAQAERNIVGEMRATQRKHSSVLHGTALINAQTRRFCADIH